MENKYLSNLLLMCQELSKNKMLENKPYFIFRYKNHQFYYCSKAKKVKSLDYIYYVKLRKNKELFDRVFETDVICKETKEEYLDLSNKYPSSPTEDWE